MTSQFRQDEFVSYILEGATDGTFLDIGAGWAKKDSNSAWLESLGWAGHCIDNGKDGKWEDSGWAGREAVLIIADATTYDYGYFAGKHINYLSLDVDEASCLALDRLLKTAPGITFSVITIEHDEYRFGADIREDQRRLLHNEGFYELLCPSVYPSEVGKDIVWEDWWVNVLTVPQQLKSLIRGMRNVDEILQELHKNSPIDIRTLPLSASYQPLTNPPATNSAVS